MRGVDVLSRADGTMLALFESRYWLDRLVDEQPELTLEPLVAGELARPAISSRQRVPSGGGVQVDEVADDLRRRRTRCRRR